DLYEYQARDLFEAHGVPVLPGIVAETPEDAKAAAEKLGGVTVVKAQVKVGGRGKAGGVKVAKNADEAYTYAKEILGMDIKGHTVHQVMIAAGADIKEEYYFSMLLDRANRTYLAMASVEGGMDIEQLAEERPDDLARVPVSPTTGLNREVAEQIAKEAKFADDLQSGIADVLVKLGEVFEKEDATLVEVNPLGGTVDAKGGSYGTLAGCVGVTRNGAGLVMSTLDVVACAGEGHGNVKPGVFLDIGGGADAQVVADRREVILGDEEVKSVFVN